MQPFPVQDHLDSFQIGDQGIRIGDDLRDLVESFPEMKVQGVGPVQDRLGGSA